MRFREPARLRLRVVAFFGALALGSMASRGAPPARTVNGLAAALSRASGGAVRTEDVRWESPRGFFTEALFGRRALFLAAVGPEGARDLFRARVRLSLEGHPVSVSGLWNLTRTPRGDDQALDLRGSFAAFATVGAGRVQGVTVLGVDGVGPLRRPRSLLGRLASHVVGLHRTGSWDALDELHVVWASPPGAARITLTPPKLHVSVDEGSSEVDLDLLRSEIVGRSSALAPNGPTLGSPAIETVVRDESGRTTPSLVRDAALASTGALGRRALRAFSEALDGVHRARGLALRAFRVYREAKAAPLRPIPPSTSFPPPDLVTPFELPADGEGKWEPLSPSWLPVPERAPKEAVLAVTFLRTDPARPDSRVVLVAMDFRALEITGEGGYEAPPPLAGPPGRGRLPSDPEARGRIVAVMNGGERGGGHDGMRVRGRDLVPPAEEATTLVVTDEGTAGIGPFSTAPEGVSFLRQGPDALHGTASAGIVTTRSALCRLESGHFVFAWGRSASESALAEALRRTGCGRAVGLSLGARARGLAAVSLRHPEAPDFALADQSMSVSPAEYLAGSPDDFLYVRFREAVPKAIGAFRWISSPGDQPEPTWLPGIFEARVPEGELDVQVFGFEAGRFDWVLRSGLAEPADPAHRSRKTELGSELAQSVVASVGLGQTTDALRYGLAFQGQPALELRQTYATLVLAPGRTPKILAPGDRPALRADEDAVQVPLLAERGEVDASGADRGSLRVRGAACVTRGGRFLVAMARHDSSEPLATALITAGCTRVVGLDRGSRHPAFVTRTGVGAPPPPTFDQSRLFAISRPMTPRSVAF